MEFDTVIAIKQLDNGLWLIGCDDTYITFGSIEKVSLHITKHLCDTYDDKEDYDK